MKSIISIIIALILFFHSTSAQVPNPALSGYWQNWNDANAPYLQLDNIDSRYNIIDIAFAVPHSGTDFQMEFIPDQVMTSILIGQIQTLQSQGKKVIISIGGASAPVSLGTQSKRDTFISTMNTIISSYGFDGIDIDLEGNSLSVSGGTIANPADNKIINLIYAIKQIMQDYFIANGKRLILTMAPETAYVQGGLSAYGGIWGAYLPVIDALRDSIEILHVQLYNSGSMYGIDGNIYSQGTSDFIVAMTEAVIQGFNTAGGLFNGLPANKVAIGLPACTAAGGGFADTSIVKSAIDYLRGTGPRPGSYILTQTNGYPTLRGMMTWSINWDAVNTCESAYQYAQNFENIFGISTGYILSQSKSVSFVVTPNPSSDFVSFKSASSDLVGKDVFIYNTIGECVLGKKISAINESIEVTNLPNGLYLIKIQNRLLKFVKQ